MVRKKKTRTLYKNLSLNNTGTLLIYVTQGHEKSIGPEIFLKAFSLLSKAKQVQVTYITDNDSLVNTLNSFCKNFKVMFAMTVT